MSEGFLLRIKYRITGRLAYLSHLETIRSVERIVRRAGLPFAITEGFNPHMKIAFGPALPVGAGSRSEYVDVRLKEYVAPERALASLRAAAPRNLMPIACEYVPVGSDAIDVAFPVSAWRVELDASRASLEQVERAFERLLDRGYIEVRKVKGRKETVKRVDFEGRLVEGPHFALLRRSEQGQRVEEPREEDPSTPDLQSSAQDDSTLIVVEFSTYQGNAGALRPDRFVAAACELMDAPATIKSLSRLELRPA